MSDTKKQWSKWSCSSAVAVAMTVLASPQTGCAITVSQVAASAQATASSGTANATNQHRIVLETIEQATDTEPAAKKEVPWLGVGTEEASEALAAQLGLKAGEGLVVTYVDEESPAAKAGLEKNDVLVEFDGQMLVHSGQLRKLVQMHKVGDAVKLTYFRSGKKETLTATLGKTTNRWSEGRDWDGNFRELHQRLKDLPIKDAIREEMERVREALARAGIDQESVQREIRRSLEAARKGMDEALRNATNAHRTFGPTMRTLRELANRGVVVDDDATVTVKSHRKSVRSIVKTDESGTYVVVANPRKQLTAHDKSGKVLFDGEIETPEQQEKVPAEVWGKVKPMLEQLGSADQSGEKSETK